MSTADSAPVLFPLSLAVITYRLYLLPLFHSCAGLPVTVIMILKVNTIRAGGALVGEEMRSCGSLRGKVEGQDSGLQSFV